MLTTQVLHLILCESGYIFQKIKYESNKFVTNYLQMLLRKGKISQFFAKLLVGWY